MAGPYFVRTTGNDSTGDGSTGNPWASISKALSVCVGGETVNVGTGSYAENTGASGHFTVTNAAGVDITVQSETGARDVTITGVSDAVVNTIVQSSATHVVFKNLIFGMRVNTQTYACRLAQCSSIQFIGCQFAVKQNAGQINIGLNVQPTGAGTTVSFICNGCNFAADGNTSKIFGATANNATGNTIVGSFINCTSSGFVGDSLYFNGGTITVTGGSYANGGSATHCLSFGIDSNTGGNPTTATLSGVRIDFSVGSIGHGLLFGNGCVSCTADNCYISGEDLGCVLKEHTGTVISNCLIYTGSSAAAYFKAANGCTFRNCVIVADQNGSAALRLGAGDTGNKNQNNIYRYNRVIAANGGNAFNFGPAGALDDLGGEVVDGNIYDLRHSTGNFGTVGASTNISKFDFAALKTAWAAYVGAPANDVNSRLLVPLQQTRSMLV